MKLTKYKHSCFSLKKNGSLLVVDPGVWSTDFTAPDNVVAVVVTHEHADHCDPEKLRAIITKNPAARIYGPLAVTSHLPDLPVQAVSPSETLQVGEFTLAFVGGVHATIHKDFHPALQNLGVIIDDLLYHPGDGLALPGRPIKALSVPIVAPWEKIAESMDFLIAIKPIVAFPSHDAVLSEQGRELYDRWHTQAAEKCGATYLRIDTSLEIA